MDLNTDHTAYRWAAVDGLYVPVWVELDTGTHAPDPLMDAVSELLEAGFSTVDRIARGLHLDASLIESALSMLGQQGDAVVDADGRWTPQAADPDDAEPTTEPPELDVREAWIAWDPAHGRALPAIWLDGHAPRRDLSDTRPADPDARVVDVRGGQDPNHPPPDAVRKQIGLLTLHPELDVYESVGGRPTRLPSGAIRRIRHRNDRNRRGPLWIRFGFRPPSGHVVFRPRCIADPETSRGLSPGGWEDLVDRASDEGAAELTLMETHERFQLPDDLLREHGYRDLADLKDVARTACDARLAGLSRQHARWRPTEAAVEAALYGRRVAQMTEQGPRAEMQPWVTVLETALGEAGHWARPHLAALRERAQGVQRPLGRANRDRLGPTAAHLPREGLSVKRLDQVIDHLSGATDTLGIRLFALGVALAHVPAARDAFGAVFDPMPDWFTHADRANRIRTDVVHVSTPESELIPDAFEGDVLQVVRGLLSLP